MNSKNLTNKQNPYEYDCTVTNVVDGDTVDVLIRMDIGFKVIAETAQRLRLARIDAPELRRGSDEEKKRGQDAKTYLSLIHI